MAFQNPTTGVIVEQENRDPQDLANQGFVPVADTTPLIEENNPPDSANIVDSNVLGGENTPDFIASEDTPIITPEIPEIQMTAPEQEAQGQIDILQELNQLTEGESNFRGEQEEEAGLPGMIEMQNDLTAQLKALQNEANQIPLLMQQDATGKGMTAGGLRPLQTARLRENAIQALSTASLLEASRGNISTAQTLVDRAVAQKYDPIKEKIRTVTANLNLIINSPEYSVAEKNRAQQQLAIQEARAKEVAEQEQEETAVKNVALELSTLINDAPALNLISNATSALEAMNMAGRLMEGGWQYVATPAERDRLKAQGYEIYENKALGRTYAKKPEEETTENNATVQAYVNQVRSGGLKLASVPASIRDAVVASLGDTQVSGGVSNRTIDINGDLLSQGYQEGDVFEKSGKYYVVGVDGKARTATAEEKKLFTQGEDDSPEAQMSASLSTVVGADGFVSPDDYLTARNAWIEVGLSPTTFDTKFKGFRNPNNPNYVISKQ